MTISFCEQDLYPPNRRIGRACNSSEVILLELVPNRCKRLRDRRQKLAWLNYTSVAITYTPAQLGLLDTPLWFCLKAQPKREHLAASGLRKTFGIACFSPRLRFRKMTRRGPVWFVEAMFPGYLFAEFNYVEMNRRVGHSPGVQRLVQFGDNVATLDPDTVAALRQHADEGEIVTIDPEIEIGQAVRIAEGPFQGLEALVTQLLPAKERIRVLLEFLNRPLEIQIQISQVLPMKPPRF
jgi:transcriptional antiterminator RfaH